MVSGSLTHGWTETSLSGLRRSVTNMSHRDTHATVNGKIPHKRTDNGTNTETDSRICTRLDQERTRLWFVYRTVKILVDTIISLVYKSAF